MQWCICWMECYNCKELTIRRVSMKRQLKCPKRAVAINWVNPIHKCSFVMDFSPRYIRFFCSTSFVTFDIARMQEVGYTWISFAKIYALSTQSTVFLSTFWCLVRSSFHMNARPRNFNLDLWWRLLRREASLFSYPCKLAKIVKSGCIWGSLEKKIGNMKVATFYPLNHEETTPRIDSRPGLNQASVSQHRVSTDVSDVVKSWVFHPTYFARRKMEDHFLDGVIWLWKTPQCLRLMLGGR